MSQRVSFEMLPPTPPKIVELLTRADCDLLRRAHKHPIEADTVVEDLGTDLLWLMHYGLIATSVDLHDRVWIGTTKKGWEVLNSHPA